MLNHVKEFDFSVGDYCLHVFIFKNCPFTSLEWFAKAAEICKRYEQ